MNNIRRRDIEKQNTWDDLKEHFEDNRFIEKIWDRRDRLGQEFIPENELEPISEEVLNELGYKLWKN